MAAGHESRLLPDQHDGGIPVRRAGPHQRRRDVLRRGAGSGHRRPRVGRLGRRRHPGRRRTRPEQRAGARLHGLRRAGRHLPLRRRRPVFRARHGAGHLHGAVLPARRLPVQPAVRADGSGPGQRSGCAFGHHGTQRPRIGRNQPERGRGLLSHAGQSAPGQDRCAHQRERRRRNRLHADRHQRRHAQHRADPGDGRLARGLHLHRLRGLHGDVQRRGRPLGSRRTRARRRRRPVHHRHRERGLRRQPRDQRRRRDPHEPSGHQHGRQRGRRRFPGPIGRSGRRQNRGARRDRRGRARAVRRGGVEPRAGRRRGRADQRSAAGRPVVRRRDAQPGHLHQRAGRLDGRGAGRRRRGQLDHRCGRGPRFRRARLDQRRDDRRQQPRRSGFRQQLRRRRGADLRRGRGADEDGGAAGGRRGRDRGLCGGRHQSRPVGGHRAPGVGTPDQRLGLRRPRGFAGGLRQRQRPLDGRRSGRERRGNAVDPSDGRGRHHGYRDHQPRPDRRARSARSGSGQQRSRGGLVRQFPDLDQDVRRGGFRASRGHDHLRRRGQQFRQPDACGGDARRRGSARHRLRARQLDGDADAAVLHDRGLHRFRDVRGPGRGHQRHGGGLGRRRWRRPGAGQSVHRRRRRGRILCAQDGGRRAAPKLRGHGGGRRHRRQRHGRGNAARPGRRAQLVPGDQRRVRAGRIGRAQRPEHQLLQRNAGNGGRGPLRRRRDVSRRPWRPGQPQFQQQLSLRRRRRRGRQHGGGRRRGHQRRGRRRHGALRRRRRRRRQRQPGRHQRRGLRRRRFRRQGQFQHRPQRRRRRRRLGADQL